MEKILNTYKNFIGLSHYDIYISKYINLKNYCFMPMLFDQNYPNMNNVVPYMWMPKYTTSTDTFNKVKPPEKKK
jgi:hypothetical protein